MTNAPEKEPQFQFGDPYALGIGLLIKDFKLWIGLYLALIAPLFVMTYLEIVDPQWWLGVRAAVRALELIFFFYIGQRIFRSFEVEPKPFSRMNFIAYFAIGIALWIFGLLPTQMINPHVGAEKKLFVSIIVLAGFTTGYVFYFYFVPCFLGRFGLRGGVEQTLSYLRSDKFLPLKACLAPVGILYLLQGLVSAVSPDGRLKITNYLLEACSEIFWLGSSYLSLALALSYLSERAWHEAGLDPYRVSRFTTISLNAPSWLKGIMKPSAGVQFLLLSLLVWTGNYVRLAQLPPAAIINVQSIELEGREARLVLELKDEKYQFRGFRPIQFRLAGSENKVISKALSRAIMEGQTNDARFGLPTSGSPTVLHLAFETDRVAEDLSKLEDVYLWYGGTKVSLLDFKKAKVLLSQ